MVKVIYIHSHTKNNNGLTTNNFFMSVQILYVTEIHTSLLNYKDNTRYLIFSINTVSQIINNTISELLSLMNVVT